MTGAPPVEPGAVDEPERPEPPVVSPRGRLLLDLAPLRRHPAYRRIYLAQVVSFLGTQVTAVAVPLQVYALTRSSLAVGLTGLVALVPLVAFGLFGGAIADAVDRRRLVLGTTLGLAAVSALLTVQAAAGVGSVGLLWVLVAAQAGLAAVDQPARRTYVPRLVDVDELPATAALDQVQFNVGLVLGPLLAGAVVAGLGPAWAYGLDTLTFLATLSAVARLPAMPPEGGGQRAGMASVLDGLRFLRTRRNLLMTFLVDINAMVFGMPRALFPALAATRYGGDAAVAGFLYAAPGAGALLGALFGGWFGRVHRQGVAVVLAIVGWGAAITVFGLSGSLVVALVMLALAGLADMVSAVYRNTILNVATPDAMRGRLGGVFIVVVTGGPRLGDLEAGAVAALSSPEVSVVSGGLACIAGVVLLAARVPSFLRYDGRAPVP